MSAIPRKMGALLPKMGYIPANRPSSFLYSLVAPHAASVLPMATGHRIAAHREMRAYARPVPHTLGQYRASHSTHVGCDQKHTLG
eukprot:627376-Rhodomonas_salina.5